MTQADCQYDILEVLHARSGIIAAAGAGGKKTMLYRIASAHPGRVIVTGTVKLNFSFPLPCVQASHEALPAAVAKAATEHGKFCFAQASETSKWLKGIRPSDVGAFRATAQADVVLVKADGARRHDLKAPCADEPVFPCAVDTVLYVVSVRPIGERLSDDWVHRLDHFSAVTGAVAGAIITPAHIARLLTSPLGALQNTGSARLIPIINKVDNEADRANANEAAMLALAMTGRFDTVVLACMANPDNPIVDVVSRKAT